MLSLGIYGLANVVFMATLTIKSKGSIITVMQVTHQAHRDELDVLLTFLKNTTDIQAKSTLWKFYKNTRLIWVELDKEMIQCRRRGKLTQKYTDLEVLYAENIKNFEQWVTMAALIYT